MANYQPQPLSPEVTAVLSRLRQQIRRYLFWEGLALVVALAGLLFWGSFLVDAVYFNISRLELPRWLRAVFLIASLAMLAGGLVSLLAFRTLRTMRGRALALVLERRFPQLGDGLITAVEAADGDWQPKGALEEAMLRRSIADAGRTVKRLDTSSIFDPRPLRRAAIAAVVLLVSILGLAVVDSAAMDRWLDGYWRLQQTYWPRKTELIVRVVTQPGDRQRDFRDRRFRHPRGGDLLLVVTTAEGKEAPDRVRLDYRLKGGSWRRTYLTSSGDQPFQQGFPALLDNMEFWISGGDYASPAPWHIDVVEPPRVDSLQAAVLYPEYTGMNEAAINGVAQRTVLPVQGAQMTLPIGSDLQLIATSNKPLSRVRVEIDAGQERYEWNLSRGPAENKPGVPTVDLTARARDDIPQAVATWPADLQQSMWSADGRTFTLPLVLQHQGDLRLREVIAAAESAKSSLPASVPFPPDSVLRIHLEDDDGIPSPEPLRFSLNSQVDQPPVIEVALKGISSIITRQARIPVAGSIRDDYGLATARFDYVIGNELEWKPQALVNPPNGSAKEFELARSETQPYERFDVLPLDLSVKQQFALTVFAADGDNLNGPNEQRSQKFVFTIVTVEELLSELYTRELNLRKRFELIISELKALQKDLAIHRELGLALPGQTGETRQQSLTALAACGERSLHAIRKSASELMSVDVAFQEIRDELVNNAAETPQNMERLEGKILGPLARVNGDGFPAMDAALGLFSLANTQGRDPVPAIREAEGQLTSVIAVLERVLLEMKKLETFHEAMELLKAIMESQSEIAEETKTQRKERALRALDLE